MAGKSPTTSKKRASLFSRIFRSNRDVDTTTKSTHRSTTNLATPKDEEQHRSTTLPRPSESSKVLRNGSVPGSTTNIANVSDTAKAQKKRQAPRPPSAVAAPKTSGQSPSGSLSSGFEEGSAQSSAPPTASNTTSSSPVATSTENFDGLQRITANQLDKVELVGGPSHAGAASIEKPARTKRHAHGSTVQNGTPKAEENPKSHRLTGSDRRNESDDEIELDMKNVDYVPPARAKSHYAETPVRQPGPSRGHKLGHVDDSDSGIQLSVESVTKENGINLSAMSSPSVDVQTRSRLGLLQEEESKSTDEKGEEIEVNEALLELEKSVGLVTYSVSSSSLASDHEVTNSHVNGNTDFNANKLSGVHEHQEVIYASVKRTKDKDKKADQPAESSEAEKHGSSHSVNITLAESPDSSGSSSVQDVSNEPWNDDDKGLNAVGEEKEIRAKKVKSSRDGSLDNLEELQKSVGMYSYSVGNLPVRDSSSHDHSESNAEPLQSQSKSGHVAGGHQQKKSPEAKELQVSTKVDNLEELQKSVGMYSYSVGNLPVRDSSSHDDSESDAECFQTQSKSGHVAGGHQHKKSPEAKELKVSTKVGTNVDHGVRKKEERVELHLERNDVVDVGSQIKAKDHESKSTVLLTPPNSSVRTDVVAEAHAEKKHASHNKVEADSHRSQQDNSDKKQGGTVQIRAGQSYNSLRDARQGKAMSWHPETIVIDKTKMFSTSEENRTVKPADVSGSSQSFTVRSADSGTKPANDLSSQQKYGRRSLYFDNTVSSSDNELKKSVSHPTSSSQVSTTVGSSKVSHDKNTDSSRAASGASHAVSSTQRVTAPVTNNRDLKKADNTASHTTRLYVSSRDEVKVTSTTSDTTANGVSKAVKKAETSTAVHQSAADSELSQLKLLIRPGSRVSDATRLYQTFDDAPDRTSAGHRRATVQPRDPAPASVRQNAASGPVSQSSVVHEASFNESKTAARTADAAKPSSPPLGPAASISSSSTSLSSSSDTAEFKSVQLKPVPQKTAAASSTDAPGSTGVANYKLRRSVVAIGLPTEDQESYSNTAVSPPPCKTDHEAHVTKTVHKTEIANRDKHRAELNVKTSNTKQPSTDTKKQDHRLTDARERVDKSEERSKESTAQVDKKPLNHSHSKSPNETTTDSGGDFHKVVLRRVDKAPSNSPPTDQTETEQDETLSNRSSVFGVLLKSRTVTGGSASHAVPATPAAVSPPVSSTQVATNAAGSKSKVVSTRSAPQSEAVADLKQTTSGVSGALLKPSTARPTGKSLPPPKQSLHDQLMDAIRSAGGVVGSSKTANGESSASSGCAQTPNLGSTKSISSTPSENASVSSSTKSTPLTSPTSQMSPVDATDGATKPVVASSVKSTRSARVIGPPKLTPHEELMIAIRNAAGSTSRKSSSGSSDASPSANRSDRSLTEQSAPKPSVNPSVPNTAASKQQNGVANVAAKSTSGAVPVPPPPPPVLPTSSTDKPKPVQKSTTARNIGPPALDPREELLAAIRNAAGGKTLRKVSTH